MKYLTLLLGLIISFSSYSQSGQTLAPSPCLFYQYEVRAEGVFLGLLPSSSSHVIDHKLYRKKSESVKWDLLESFGSSVPQIYWDQTVESNEDYSYKWVAEDDLGRRSNTDHSIIHVTSFDSKISYAPQITMQSTDEGIYIKLPDDIPGQDYRIELIRSIQGSPYRTAKILKEGSTSFVDKIRIDEVDGQKKGVRYRARILYKDGKRSKFGEEISLS